MHVLDFIEQHIGSMQGALVFALAVTLLVFTLYLARHMDCNQAEPC